MQTYKGGNNGGLTFGNKIQATAPIKLKGEARLAAIAKQPSEELSPWERFELARIKLLPALNAAAKLLLSNGVGSSAPRVVALREAAEALEEARFPGRPPNSPNRTALGYTERASSKPQIQGNWQHSANLQKAAWVGRLHKAINTAVKAKRLLDSEQLLGIPTLNSQIVEHVRTLGASPKKAG